MLEKEEKARENKVRPLGWRKRRDRVGIIGRGTGGIKQRCSEGNVWKLYGHKMTLSPETWQQMIF